MAILTYGNWVAQSVAEEKSGRVMELLITAATPRQLLTGKVLGSGAARLTQYLAIVAAAIIGFVANAPISKSLGVSGQSPISLPDLNAWMLLAFGAFFLLGFVLYSTLYAAASSMVAVSRTFSRQWGRSSSCRWRVTSPPLPASMIPMRAGSACSRWSSSSARTLMPARMLLTSVGSGEILVALAILAVTLIAAMLFASRIYSAGVLMYGQRVGLRTIWRASRVSR